MIGANVYLDGIRASIAQRRTTIARLAASGTPVREYVLCKTNDEYRMDVAVCGIRVLKQRYREVLADYRTRRGLRLPDAMETRRIAA